MNLSDRSKSELLLILKKIENNSFNEDHIKDLLINWRPHFPKDSMIWELACFMAHTEARDRGVFHKELDSRYAKIVYGNTIGGQFNKQLYYYKIDSKLFNTLLIGGIETTDELFLIEKTGMNKIQAINEIKRLYRKDGSNFLLNPFQNYTRFLLILDVILGMINMTAAIDNEEIIKQFKEGLKKTCEIIGIDQISLTDENEIDILICIACLLHSHQFILFDNSEGECYIKPSLNQERLVEINLWAKVLNISWPLMTISDKEMSYIPEIKLNGFRLENDNIGFNAIRNSENNLIISTKE